MSGAPFYYNYINACNSAVSPSTVHCKNTILTSYFTKYLLQKAMSPFKWTTPKHWDKNYMLYVLYCFGYFAVINTDKFGIIPQACGLQGYGVMYQPTNAVISNPLLTGILTPRIGVDTEIVRLQPDYSGVMDIVGYYSDLMALTAEAAGMNLVNSKLSYVFFGGNKKVAETFKKLYDRIASGEVASVIDKSVLADDGSVPWELFDTNVGNNYLVDKLLGDLRKIELMFDSDIGIPNSNTEKKERLTDDEVNINNFETISKCALWLELLQEQCVKVNDMFDIGLGVDWREEVKPYVINTERIRSVPMGQQPT